MYTISNRHMEEIIRYVEEYRRSVDLDNCDDKTFNNVRMAGILLRKLRAKQPLSLSDPMK